MPSIRLSGKGGSENLIFREVDIMTGVAIRLHYHQDGEIRFLKGFLLEENEQFIKIELNNYIVTIARDQIAKMEVEK